MSEVLALLVSDIHLSEKPPVARSDEPDWFGTMEGYLGELCDLAGEYEAPICSGGDVVDRWKSSPALVNMAINHLPTMFSVAGQHDLPFHRLDAIGNSAFETLRLSRNIRYIPTEKYYIKGVCLHGFSWEEEITPPPSSSSDRINVLVAHKYVWHGNAKYPLAQQNQELRANKDIFEGYDVALLGDNHKSWKAKIGNCLVYNPGSFMRRRSDDINHRPQVGLLKDDGTINIHYLDISKDILTVTEKTKVRETSEFQMEEFLDGLKGLGEAGLDFVESVKMWMKSNDVRRSVKQLLVKAMEGE